MSRGIPMRELFIYYRLQITQVSEVAVLEQKVLTMQQQIEFQFHGLKTRLLRRENPSGADKERTWMEIYTFPETTEGVSLAIEQAIEQSAHALFGRMSSVQRHREVFLSCVS
jgi:hypothetical protein